VINKCRKESRDAIAANLDIKDVGLRRKVMLDILNETITHLESVFGTDIPSKIFVIKNNTRQFAMFQNKSTPEWFRTSWYMFIQQCSEGQGMVDLFLHTVGMALVD
jgi:hypothetical protein